MRIAKDKKTGRSRGFAYLDFDSKATAETAVAALAGNIITNDPHNQQTLLFIRSNVRGNDKWYECDFLINLLLSLGLQYEGRDLKIDLSEPRTGEARSERPKAVRTPSENSVFVGNLGE